MSNNLFNILDGINDSDYAEQTLSSVDEIQRYAEAMGEEISEGQALRIQSVGKKWRSDVKNGNGEWGRMRDDAEKALESDDYENSQEWLRQGKPAFDFGSADRQFSGAVHAGQYVAFWISEDGQSSMSMTEGSFSTAEEAVKAAQEIGQEQGIEGGSYEATLVTE